MSRLQVQEIDLTSPLRVGDVELVSSLTVHRGRGRCSFRAGKDEHFAVLLLGTVPKGLDPHQLAAAVGELLQDLGLSSSEVEP